MPRHYKYVPVMCRDITRGAHMKIEMGSIHVAEDGTVSYDKARENIH